LSQPVSGRRYRLTLSQIFVPVYFIWMLCFRALSCQTATEYWHCTTTQRMTTVNYSSLRSPVVTLISCYSRLLESNSVIVINPLTPSDAIWVRKWRGLAPDQDCITKAIRYSYKATAMKHPVPDRVMLSFVIFDIRALWRSGVSIRVPECQEITKDGLTRSGTGCLGCFTAVPYSNCWLQRVNSFAYCMSLLHRTWFFIQPFWQYIMPQQIVC